MLDLDAPGTILFFGTMNAMPMMYARELRKLGQDVIYFVDVPPAETLSRPEAHYPDISYPYPDWIVETAMPSQAFPNLFPRLTLQILYGKARAQRPIGTIKAVILSGFYVALAPYLPVNAVKAFLSFGADLDAWCDVENAPQLANGMRRRSIFKFLPGGWDVRLIERVVQRNRNAAESVDFVIYFPLGTNPAGDRVIASLQEAGVSYIPRYDITFDHVEHLDRGFKSPGRKLVIVSPVRFLYRTFAEGNEDYSKGNDAIIRGLALFRAVQPDLEIHFFNKGEDLDHAKALCSELGLDDVTLWHDPVPFQELLQIMQRADICFDQVGRHLMGVGMYALFLGKPVITNISRLGFLGPSPIMHAATAEQVCLRLTELGDPKVRQEISERSKVFAEAKFGPGAVVAKLTTGTFPA